MLPAALLVLSLSVSPSVPAPLSCAAYGELLHQTQAEVLRAGPGARAEVERYLGKAEKFYAQHCVPPAVTADVPCTLANQAVEDLFETIGVLYRISESRREPILKMLGLPGRLRDYSCPR